MILPVDTLNLFKRDPVILFAIDPGYPHEGFVRLVRISVVRNDLDWWTLHEEKEGEKGDGVNQGIVEEKNEDPVLDEKEKKDIDKTTNSHTCRKLCKHHSRIPIVDAVQ